MEENELEKVKTKDKTQTLVAIFEDNTHKMRDNSSTLIKAYIMEQRLRSRNPSL